MLKIKIATFCRIENYESIRAIIYYVILSYSIIFFLTECGKVEAGQNSGFVNVPELPRLLINSEMVMYKLVGQLKNSKNQTCINMASLIINTYLGRHRALGSSPYGDQRINDLNWEFLERTDRGLKMQGCPSAS